MVYICDGCGNSSPVKDLLKHNEDTHKENKKKQEARRTCEKSGTKPHAAKK